MPAVSKSNAFTTILCVDEPHPSSLEIIRAIESMQAKVYDSISLPPEVMHALEDPRRCTAEMILDRQAKAMPRLLGLQLHVSKMLSDWPMRLHRKRRNQSWAYHHRIQKKWNKRFGVGPMAILMNTRDFLK
jgi:hypothetical protein